MYAELTDGYRTDPDSVINDACFDVDYDEMVVVRDIEFFSLCEHHLLPFYGKAHVGYVPRGKVIGLSKLARVVEVVARRPQVQERMTEDIANLLIEELDVKGVAVVIEASHSCMGIRGIRKPESMCVTSAMKGIFRSNLSSRSEVIPWGGVMSRTVKFLALGSASISKASSVAGMIVPWFERMNLSSPYSSFFEPCETMTRPAST